MLNRKAYAEGPNGSLNKGLNDRITGQERVNIRPARQLWLPFKIEGALFSTEPDTDDPIEEEQLMAEVLQSRVCQDCMLKRFNQPNRRGT